MIAPHGNLRDVLLLEKFPSVLPAGQPPLWGETTSAGQDFSVASTAPVPASASVSVSATVQFETKVSAQTPPPAPVSAQAATALPTPASTLVKAPISVSTHVSPALQSMSSAQVQAPLSTSAFTAELTAVSSINSGTLFAMDTFQISTHGLIPDPVSVPLPAPIQPAAPVVASVLEPAGIQTTSSVPECASLTTTQQNIETASISGSLQQEPCMEV